MRESLVDTDLLASTEAPVVRMLPDVHVVKIGASSILDRGRSRSLHSSQLFARL